jgi:hypothetical protein
LLKQNHGAEPKTGDQIVASAAISAQQAAAVDTVSLDRVEAGAEAQEAVVKVSMKQLVPLIQRAVLELQARFEQSVGDGVEAVLVAKGVDYDAYLRNSLTDDFACSGRLEYKNGEVWIYEFTNHPAHEAAAGEIVGQCIEVLSLNHVRPLFSTGASPSFDNNVAQLVFEPDGFVKPRGRVTGLVRDPNPNVVVEVAFSETEPHVLAKAAAWIGPGFTVQQVIVIKIGARPRVGGGRTMRALSYVRGAAMNPVQGPIDFDQVAAAGAAGMQLFINHAQLLVGAPAATVAAMAAVPDPIAMGLFHVQQAILDEL